jgi:triosephosphate isomerase
MKFLIANWKAEMNLEEVKTWTNAFSKLLMVDQQLLGAIQQKKIKIILCPSFIHIPYVKEIFKDMPDIEIGGQTVSSMKGGKFTGEVTAKALKDYATYAIIGHSERRINKQESVVDTAQKLENCKEVGIQPIFCVRNTNDFSNAQADIVAYEPVDAIGTGNNASVEQILEMKKQLQLKPTVQFLYGGSVDELNVSGYLRSTEINGFLIGTAALHASSFYTLAKHMI